jgi:glycosyltransferase involved in cell wall biosynthesis
LIAAMRLLFVHDHRFYRDDSGAVFTSGSLPAEIWDRYLAHFDSVHVVGRDGGRLPADAKYALSSRPGVTFDLVGNVTYGQLILGSRSLRDRIRSDVDACDAAVLRLPSELGFMAAAQCRKAGKPYAVEMVGCAWDAMRNHGSWSAWLYAPVFYLRTRRALRQSPLTLYVTSRWLQQRYPTRGKAYSASDVEIEPMSKQQLQSRQGRIGQVANGQPPELGTVASLRIRSKGIQTALAALEALRKEGLELRYRVLGPGDSSPWMALADQHGVADLVWFDGVRPAGEGVREWLDAIDIHLQPSFQEGLPRATVEAMSRGAACIGSTCGGIPELLPPERLHDPGDVAGLAQRIRALATNPDMLARASARDLETSSAFQPQRLAAIRSEFLADLRAATGKTP